MIRVRVVIAASMCLGMVVGGCAGGGGGESGVKDGGASVVPVGSVPVPAHLVCVARYVGSEGTMKVGRSLEYGVHRFEVVSVEGESEGGTLRLDAWELDQGGSVRREMDDPSKWKTILVVEAMGTGTCEMVPAEYVKGERYRLRLVQVSLGLFARPMEDQLEPVVVVK